MVKGCRTEHDLVISVIIHITYGNAVGSLSIETLAWRLTLMEPFIHYMLAVELYCPCVNLGIVAACEYGTWIIVYAVKICHTGKETVTAVTLKR